MVKKTQMFVVCVTYDPEPRFEREVTVDAVFDAIKEKPAGLWIGRCRDTGIGLYRIREALKL